jgi:hypothetical protein
MSKRMIDLLFAQGARQVDPRDQTTHPWSLDMLREDTGGTPGRRLFDQVETLVVDNVTRYLYEVSSQEEWDGPDFPNCAPPFPTFWVETRAPATIRSGATVRPWTGHAAWGALFLASEVPDDLSAALQTPEAQQRIVATLQQQEALVQRTFAFHGVPIPATAPADPAAWLAGLPVECREVVRQYGLLQRALDTMALTQDAPKVAQWHYTIVPFLQMAPHAPILGPLLYGMALVSATGALVPIPGPQGTTSVQWQIAHGAELPAETQQAWATMGNGILMPLWLAISFLHCKNVTMTTEDPCHQRKPPTPGARCRRLHYHVLQIQPLQEILRRQGQSEHAGLKQALHICRGHFKDYRQKGLFGKYQGLFWWDSHLRGSSTVGITEKDYQIHAGRLPEGVAL